MIHPRSLDWQEDRPVRVEWVCSLHGDLKPGETTCAECAAGCLEFVEEP